MSAAPENAIVGVVPAYRAAGTVRRAVDSMLREGLRHVLVIDDGSPDDTADEARDAGAEVRRIENSGPSAARNAGLDALREATHALFLDADDELAPGALAGFARALTRAPDAACIVGAHVEIRPQNDGGTAERARLPRPAWLEAGALPDPRLALGTDHVFCTTGLLLCDRAVRAGVRFDPTLMFGEDRDLIARAGSLGPIIVTESTIVRKHTQPGRLTASPDNVRRWLRDQLLLLDRHAPPHDHAACAIMRPALEWTAKNTLRTLARTRTKLPSAEWNTMAAAFSSRGWRVPLGVWRWRVLSLAFARAAVR